ncbi:MAG: Cof-type HAD-IIB family hydrolase [Saccharofermentans sp.]|nr:Cof-type HAD-IIB family hydrolase [Saccharofermentans sp.]
MSNYRFLVATDMDYTLLISNKPVSDLNRAAIKAIRDAGGAFTIATGRTSYLTGTYIRDLDIDIPLITSNGAALLDPHTFKDIYSLDFEDETLDKLMATFKKHQADATGYSSEGVFFCPNSSRRDFIYGYNEGIAEDIKAVTGEISYEQNSTNLPKFNKFLLIKPSEELVEEISKIDDLEVVSSAKDFLDIMRKGSSKGIALTTLSESLNIPKDRVFSIGDSPNDIPLLEHAGHPMAMGGSDKAVLEKAEYITTTFEEDGFGRAIYDFVLPTIERMSLS